MTEPTHRRMHVALARLGQRRDHHSLYRAIGQRLELMKRREDGATVFNGTETDMPEDLDLLDRAEQIIGPTP